MPSLVAISFYASSLKGWLRGARPAQNSFPQTAGLFVARDRGSLQILGLELASEDFAYRIRASGLPPGAFAVISQDRERPKRVSDRSPLPPIKSLTHSPWSQTHRLNSEAPGFRKPRQLSTFTDSRAEPNNVRFSRGAVMNGSGGVSHQCPRFLNSVPLDNAVLCADCDVISDSPHDICLVCGSRSLFNIARIFGGKLPQERANLITQDIVEVRSRDVVLTFPKPHRPRRRATAEARQLTVVAFDDNESDEVERGVLCGPQGR